MNSSSEISHRGKVVSITPEITRVEIVSESACGACHAKGLCSLGDAKVKVGAPYVEGAVVKATVLDDTVKADKVIVFKKIRRKGFQKLNGHRQKLSKIRINEIA